LRKYFKKLCKLSSCNFKEEMIKLNKDTNGMVASYKRILFL